ncbi:DNA cytosine methyltransferase [Flavobacterium granuli]|uniref:DNA (cytosine-5-)-methyltransferase n=1 Tax=Flavobacterium granuli TaxID=280093 RepID=A0ABU1S0D7_9FLAO|nr:DNA cytosine methyltransferase [Flavobacterium granuli]MDR6844487.1 DNA (cytosine-5)-methyltransferase 1 [Flavobacterium granuli]
MIYVVDLFCGGGGTSTGASQAENVKVIYCVNHDPIAIKSHAANHPDCIHAIEDIRKLDLTVLKNLIAEIREKDPTALFALWASLECTNHSKAKGGMSRDSDSRTLAYDLLRYLEIDFDVVYIENVREFMIWGPLRIKEGKKSDHLQSELALDKKGCYHMVPVPEYKAVYYNDWVSKMESHGFNFDHRILNAADFDAYTSRIRYFAQFAKPHFNIEWPEPTNSKKVTPENKLKPWNAVKDVLDLEEKGESIFIPGRITSDKTFERILGGCIVHVAKLNQKQFIQKYYGTGKNVQGIDTVSPTVPTKDRMALMSVNHFVYRDFGRETNSSIDSIAGTMPTNPKMNLISTDPLILNFNSSTSPVTSSKGISPTVTTVRTHYIINPSWFSLSTRSIEDPAPTLIARMDKAPHYLITTETGELAIEVYETDLPHAVKLKEFMAMYGLKDILMRMFSEVELLRIMGFPEGYILKGTKTQNKKFIGNAVEVKQAKAILSTSSKANSVKEKELAA